MFEDANNRDMSCGLSHFRNGRCARFLILIAAFSWFYHPFFHFFEAGPAAWTLTPGADVQASHWTQDRADKLASSVACVETCPLCIIGSNQNCSPELGLEISVPARCLEPVLHLAEAKPQARHVTLRIPRAPPVFRG
jgi:hypothetical protein